LTVLLTRKLAYEYARDGMVLGAAVGFRLAAFESAGYAFTALFTERGMSLEQLVQTEKLRGLLASVGHWLRTAILEGVLFSRRAVDATSPSPAGSCWRTWAYRCCTRYGTPCTALPCSSRSC
jgi:RsiW-degrading membrane proteinase PrsW (M82 family)